MFNFIAMKVCKYNIIGVMSGTSLDGIDLAHVVYTLKQGDKETWSFEVLKAQTIPYSDSWRDTLSRAVTLDKQQLDKLDEAYTVYLAQVIQDFILQNNLQDIDAVSSHGHTVLHRPDLGYTLQIGNLGFLADLINQKVVCDFRVQDVQLNGQGAPLVPIGDLLLFADFPACINLGGFANISFDNKSGVRVAFDICPVNVLLNKQANRLGLLYDQDGNLASKGIVCQDLLQQLNELDFYNLIGPKSLGVEYVDTYVQPILDTWDLPCSDMLSTLCEHIAYVISKVVIKQGFKSVLLSGGGAHNNYLIKRLRVYCPEVDFVRPSKDIIDYKEAIIFGLLGVLAMTDRINVLSSVTGACKDHCSGKIYTTYKPIF